MKICKKCQSKMDNEFTSCIFCGSSDLINEEDNKEISNINEDLQSISSYPNETEINNNNITVNNSKKISSKYITKLYLVSISMIILSIITSFIFKGSYNSISKEEFKKILENKKYIVSDLTSTYKKEKYIDTFYVAKNNNIDYRISYISFNDEQAENEYYERLKLLLPANDSEKLKNTKKIKNLEIYKLESNFKYLVISKIDNTIIYATVDNKNQKELNNDLNALGYLDKTNIITKILFILPIVILTMLLIVSMFKIFKKSGRNGLLIFVPLYNLYVLADIAIGNGLFLILFFIPIVNMYMFFKLAKIFGKDTKYSIIFALFSIILLPYLAFDNSQYLGIKKI